MRKPDYCICENKGPDQLRGNREADQRLCFSYLDSKIPLLLKSKISSLYLYSVASQAGLCQTWSETSKTGFLTMRLILYDSFMDGFKINAVLRVSDQIGHRLGCNSCRRDCKRLAIAYLGSK